MCRAIVFRLVPTSLEIVAVVSVLSRMFRPEVGAIVAATSLTYIAFTAAMTQVCACVPLGFARRLQKRLLADDTWCA